MNKEIIKRILEGFDPVKHNLPVDFLLTNLTELKGCGCKVAQEVSFLPLNNSIDRFYLV